MRGSAESGSSGPPWATPGHPELPWAALVHSGPPSATLSHPGSPWLTVGYLDHPEPPWDTPGCFPVPRVLTTARSGPGLGLVQPSAGGSC